MKHSEIVGLFDRIAPLYDRSNRLLSFGLDMRWRKALTRHLPSGAALLDAATGTGDQIQAFLSAGASFQKAVGIDLSQPMLDAAQKKFAKQRGCNVEFYLANAEQLPFEDGSFDVCSCSFGIRNMANPFRMLKELRRVTKPNGRCLILEFSIPTGLLKRPYLCYIRNVLPHLGRWAGQEASAYNYLSRTIEHFARTEQCLDWMKAAGWKSPIKIPLYGGIVSLYRGDALEYDLIHK